MKYLQEFIFLFIAVLCQGIPLQNDNLKESKFIIASVEHINELPQNAIEVNHHLPKSTKDNNHVLNIKQTDAISFSHVKPYPNVLVNKFGIPVVAEPTANTDEDMVTADNIVFRPSFTYRRNVAQRRRIYQPENYNRRLYIPKYYYPQYKPANAMQYKDVPFPVLP